MNLILRCEVCDKRLPMATPYIAKVYEIQRYDGNRIECTQASNVSTYCIDCTPTDMLDEMIKDKDIKDLVDE